MDCALWRQRQAKRAGQQVGGSEGGLEVIKWVHWECLTRRKKMRSVFIFHLQGKKERKACVPSGRSNEQVGVHWGMVQKKKKEREERAVDCFQKGC